MEIKKAAEYIGKKDLTMKQVIEKVGLIELPKPKSNFESLANAIVSQQLSVKAADTIYKRFLQALDYELSPEKVLSTPPDTLRLAGLSGQKTKYIAALANAFIENDDAFANLHELPNEEVIKLLTNINGIGVWTTQMFLMFNLLREDIFPVGDLGIRRAVEKHYFKGQIQEHHVLTEKAELWKPYRTVASFYLWRSLEITK